jgi:cytochrome P450
MRLLSRTIGAKLVYGTDMEDPHTSLLFKIEDWFGLNHSSSANLVQMNWPLTSYRRMLELAEEIERKHLAALKAKIEAKSHNDDLISALCHAYQANQHEVMDLQVVAQAISLFSAVSETTAHVLTWALFLLAQHPRIQADLLDELTVLAGGRPTAQRLEQLPVLNNILRETIRIIPVTALDRRITSKETEAGPYFLPRGSLVLLNHYATHHSAELFAEPEHFSPERWELRAQSIPASDLLGRVDSATAVVPFIHSLAKTALAMIQPRWRLTIEPHTRIDRLVALTLSPRGGIPVILSRQDRRFETYPIYGNVHEMVHFPDAGELSSSVVRRAA